MKGEFVLEYQAPRKECRQLNLLRYVHFRFVFFSSVGRALATLGSSTLDVQIILKQKINKEIFNSTREHQKSVERQMIERKDGGKKTWNVKVMAMPYSE